MASLSESDLERLSWILDHAEGFSLNFIKANLPATRDEVLRQLRDKAARPIVTVGVTAGPTTLVGQFQKGHEAAPAGAALVISIPEPYIEYDAPGGVDRNVVDLDLKRNVLVASGRSIIFVLSLGALNAVSRYAPDFYDFRTLTFEVDESSESRAELKELRSAEDALAMGRENNERLVRLLRLELESAEMDGAGGTTRAAALHLELARALRALGLASESLPHAEAARRLYTELVGPTDAAALTSANDLACTYSALGRYADALRLDQEVFKLSREQVGESHPDTLTIMGNLAATLSHLGRHEEALKLCEDALRLRREKLGESHPDTLTSMGNLAVTYSKLGRHEEALKLEEQVLKLSRERLGESHPDTLTNMGNLAATYSDLGRHEEALKLQEEVLQLRREKLGESHPDTLTSMGNLAATYSDLGRYDKALKLEEDALWLRREKLGESHPDSLLSMNNLGRDLQDLGRTDEALAIWRQALLLAQGTAHANLPIASTLLRNIQDALARRPDLREPGDPGNGADDPDNPGRQPPTANR